MRKPGSFVRAMLAGAAATLAALLVVAALRPEPHAPAPPSESRVAARPDLDVPYVPTENEAVAAMLELAAVDSDDFVIDLGSGDGRILIAAARERGARGLGVDIDAARIRDSGINARAAGVGDRVAFRRQDLFRTPIGEADVLALYLLPEINLRLRPRILAEMRPGARVVSNMFDMGDWRWDRRERVGSANLYLWIVPARVGGRWRLSAGGRTATLDLDQRYQRLSGTLTRPGGRVSTIERGRIEGERIRFVADLGEGPRLFEGRVEGAAIVPAARRRSPAVPAAEGWRAVRAG